MTDNSELLKDLDFAAQLAKQGANTPLLGGKYFILWSGLLIPALVLHGLVVNGFIDLENSKIGLIWMGYGITGGVLSFLFGFLGSNKAGATTTLNKLSSRSGILVSIIIFTFALAMVVSVVVGTFSYSAFNLILPFAFGISAFHLGILGLIAKLNYLKFAAIVAWLGMVTALVFNQHPYLYFFVAIFVVFSQTIPGIIELKNEKQHDGR